MTDTTQKNTMTTTTKATSCARGSVQVSPDGGTTWAECRGDGVLVIEPGAGTFCNRRAYSDLADRFQAHFVGGSALRPAGQGSLPITRQGGFKYPDGWDNIAAVDVSAAHPAEDSLLGLAKRLGEEIASGVRRPPYIVVAGPHAGLRNLGPKSRVANQTRRIRAECVFTAAQYYAARAPFSKVGHAMERCFPW